MILFRITQILDDLFGIPAERVDISDNIVEDWGIDRAEHRAFDAEFCAEFNIRSVPEGTETLAEYVRLCDES